MSKEAAPSATQISAAIGAALGIGSGTLANFILSKMTGYEGDWMSYVASGAVGGLAGGFGGAAAGDAVKKRIDHYRANPGEAGDILRKIEQDPRLRKVGDALRKNPLMRPIRRALGRPFVSLKKPVGYDSSEIKKNFDKSVKDIGLRKTLAKVIKGEPLWNTESAKVNEETEKRMLAQRAYFDLPVDESKMSEYFDVDKQDPKTWRYKKDDPYRKELDAEVKAKFHGYHPNPHYKHIPLEKKVRTKGDKEFIEDSKGFIGGFRATRDKGSDIARVADRWDYENYRGGEGYKEDVPKTSQSMGGGGYSNASAEDTAKKGILGKNRSREIERNKHLVKNILDILLGNPITLKQDIDLSKKALPKAVQERM
jgi:hypothetical protein